MEVYDQRIRQMQTTLKNISADYLDQRANMEQNNRKIKVLEREIERF